jgi:aryl-alcohol dehydrogenase-like predicted oxidoreductase
MRYRTFGRTGWQISEIGYGMWGMGGWTGADDVESMRSLERSVELGCNFFDTAWAYGDGHSEKLLGQLVNTHLDQRLYTATKIPPKSRKWPSRPGYKLEENYPPEYIRQYTEMSLKNLGLDTLDLIQFHTWNDEWGADPRWQRTVRALKDDGLVRAIGISVNRWEPENVIRTLYTGLVDAVQVIYNIFDQAPEDRLFPVCRELNVAVIARVPFDEGTLTGTLTADSRWPSGDWRNTYFVPENLSASVARAEALKPLVPPASTLPDLALRFILANPDVSTIIPGMRKVRNVEANIAASDEPPLEESLVQQLRAHRWDRHPTEWSQ